MAMIQKIRDNSALMFIVIGGALLAFILTEYLSSSSSSSELDDKVGSFEGVVISDNEFSSEREKLVFLTNGGQSFSATQEFQKGQFTNQTWNSILRDKFLANEAEELGIKVTIDEEEEMLIGNEETGDQPSAFYVNYLFGGPQKYQQNLKNISENTSDISQYAFMAVYDRQRQNIVNSVPLGGRYIWVKDFGIKIRQQEKLQRVLSNCFYTTSSLAKDEYVSNNSKKDIEIAFVKYNTVNDESIEPSDAEINAAYEKVKNQFVEKEATRKLVYATFNLEPSKEDRQAVLKDIKGLKITLEEEADAKLFIKNETEDIVDFNYYKKGEYPVKLGGIDTALFGLNEGATFGPFTDLNQTKYGVAKVLNIKSLADSAKFELAYVNVQNVINRINSKDSTNSNQSNNQAEIQKSYIAQVDSLVALAQLKSFSRIDKELIFIDSTYIKEGKLQWAQLNANLYGRNFMDSIVDCKVGDVKKVFIPSREGGGIYAILKVKAFGVKVKKMQIGSIIKAVNPGEKTQENYLAKANQVAFAIKEGKGINSLADSLDYNVDSLIAKGSTYSIRGLTDSRKIIHWAFTADLFEPSNVFSCPGSYVVAFVENESNGKFKSMNDPSVKYACEAYARKQKQKEKILASFPELNIENFENFENLYNGGLVNKESISNLKKGSSKMSREFDVNGTISGLSAGNVSTKIEGEEGIYVVKVLSEDLAELTEDTSFDIEKGQLQGAAQRNSNLLVDEYITDKSDLTDNRKILLR